MKTIQLLFFSIIPLLYSCDNQTDKTKTVGSEKEAIEPVRAKLEPISVNSLVVERYKNLKDSATTFERNIINKIILNIEKYGYKRFSEEYLTIGDIDGNIKQDTIRTKVFVELDTVYLEAKWYRNGLLLWEDKLKNPYKWISDDKLFAYKTGDIWTRLTIAKDYSVPVLLKRSKYERITNNTVVQMGLKNFKERNIDVSQSEYQNYIENFNGMLLEHGEPESKTLVIWYEPIKTFVPYYRP